MTRMYLFAAVAIVLVSCAANTGSPNAPTMVQEGPKEHPREQQEKHSEKPAPPASVDQRLIQLQGELEWVQKRLPKGEAK